MASTTFVNRVTPILAEWLNDVNDAVYEGAGQQYWSSDFGHLPTATAVVNDAALLAAIVALAAAGGGTLNIAPGTYQHISVEYSPNTYAKVNIKGAGKTATVLQKSGLTATPVLYVHGTALSEGNKLSDFSIVGNDLCVGLETIMLAKFVISNVLIDSCLIGWDNFGSLIGSVYDLDLTGNGTGYRSQRSSGTVIYPNLITFYGGQVLGNTIGYDMIHGSGVTWNNTDIEFSVTAGIYLRSTTNLEIAYTTFNLNGVWFESNIGTSLIVENTSGLLLSVRDTKVVRNLITDSATAFSIGTIETSILENVQALSSLGGNLTVTIAASRSIVLGGLFGALTDSSTSFVHTNVGTATEFIPQRQGQASGSYRANFSPTAIDVDGTGGLDIGGSKMSAIYTIADPNPSSVTTTIPVAVTSNVYGLLVHIRGRNLANGISYSRLYHLALKIPGGAGSDVTAATISSVGDATPAFTFDNNAGFLRINQATGSGGIATIFGWI